MKVELRLYPSLETNDSYTVGMFNSLPEAWEEAKRLTTVSKYFLRDFFTLEHHETNM